MSYRAISQTIALMAITIVSGCGTTKLQEATEQLVLSSAVDRSVSMIDFRPLEGLDVYLDTTYIQNLKSPTFVNADYVTSALRQQVMAGGCMLQESREQADVIIEARIGTLGADEHRVTYGLPENSGIGMAANLVTRTPSVAIPEIAVARRDAREGAAKVAAFAYDRETRVPLWQSGISQSIATSRNTWVMGVGPFQGGSIREGRRLVQGTDRSGGSRPGASPSQAYDRPAVEYSAEVRYDRGWPVVGKYGSPANAVGSGLPIAGNKGITNPKRIPVPPESTDGSSPLPNNVPGNISGGNAANTSIAEEPGWIDEDTIKR